jgi:hypothetical protein
MAINKITGSRAKLGGIAGNVDLPTCAWFNGIVRARVASTDSTRGGIQLGGMAMYIKKIAIAADWVNGGTTNERDTGWDLPSFSIVEDVWLQTITAATSATNTLNVGIQGTIQGFLKAVTPTSAWTPGLETQGSLLQNQSTNFGGRISYYANSATSKSVKVGRSATVFSSTWTGNLYIKYFVPST